MVCILFQILEIESKIINIFNLVMVILVFSHWNGCVQYLIAYSEEFPQDSWAVHDGLNVNRIS